MYEAPDRYKRMIAARLPDGEAPGVASGESDNESTPLKDVQLISRAQLAPFFAAANVMAAVMITAALWGSAPIAYLLASASFWLCQPCGRSPVLPVDPFQPSSTHPWDDWTVYTAQSWLSGIFQTRAIK